MMQAQEKKKKQRKENKRANGSNEGADETCASSRFTNFLVQLLLDLTQPQNK